LWNGSVFHRDFPCHLPGVAASRPSFPKVCPQLCPLPARAQVWEKKASRNMLSQLAF
jgi:hypothetical protein